MSRSKPGPAAHSHSVFLVALVGLGRCSTSTRITVPVTIGSSWWWGPVATAAEFGVQAVPSADLDGAVAGIGGGLLDVGGGPGVGVGEAEPVAVATGPTT